MVFVLPLAITPLAALGADVIKVEAESRPDSARWGPQPANELHAQHYNVGGNFHHLNRNKRGMTIDLQSPRGRELLLELVAKSDVVAENFTPRVIANLGLRYEELKAVNPRIILLSSSGFGQSGAWRNYKAYGPITESVDGLMHLTGHPQQPPIRGGAGGWGVAFTDVAGAYYGTYAILAALEHRERTGEGMWLDLSHYEAGVATVPEALLEFELNGRVLERVGNRDTQRGRGRRFLDRDRSRLGLRVRLDVPRARDRGPPVRDRCDAASGGRRDGRSHRGGDAAVGSGRPHSRASGRGR
jgi:crotonobetainyl-CoA:carnitine CoA-transferase CaiB-like acyl-CoA transferase